MFGNVLHPWHIVVIVIVLLLLFGSKRLPDTARGLGRSLRIFKSEMKEMQRDDDTPADGAKDEASKALPSGSSTSEVPTAKSEPTADDVKKSA